MADRDVRDTVIKAWAWVLDRRGYSGDSTVLAAEMAAIAEANGARLTAPAHRSDPAADWHEKPEPGDAIAGAQLARDELRRVLGLDSGPVVSHESQDELD